MASVLSQRGSGFGCSLHVAPLERGEPDRGVLLGADTVDTATLPLNTTPNDSADSMDRGKGSLGVALRASPLLGAAFPHRPTHTTPNDLLRGAKATLEHWPGQRDQSFRGDAATSQARAMGLPGGERRASATRARFAGVPAAGAEQPHRRPQQAATRGSRPFTVWTKTCNHRRPPPRRRLGAARASARGRLSKSCDRGHAACRSP